MTDDFTRDRQIIRRRMGLDPIRASLGDANGVIYTPGRPGLYEVRTVVGVNADGTRQFSQPFSVRLKSGISLTITPGAAIWLNYDETDELVITGGDGVAQQAQGINQIQQNPLDPYANKSVNQSVILTLNSNPTSPPTTVVYVKGWIAIVNGVLCLFPNGTIDLTSFIPADGEHCATAVGVMSDFATLEAFASTPKPTTDPLDLTDYQEALDGLSSGTIPAWIYRLHDAQTQISNSDKWLDLRQMINIGPTGGGGLPSIIPTINSRIDAILTDSNGDVLSDGNGDVLFE